MPGYTLVSLNEVKDSAPEFGLGEVHEARFATRPLEATVVVLVAPLDFDGRIVSGRDVRPGQAGDLGERGERPRDGERALGARGSRGSRSAARRAGARVAGTSRGTAARRRARGTAHPGGSDRDRRASVAGRLERVVRDGAHGHAERGRCRRGRWPGPSGSGRLGTGALRGAMSACGPERTPVVRRAP